MTPAWALLLGLLGDAPADAGEAFLEPAAVTSPADLPDEPEPKEDTIVFRWYDDKGVAHDTTDPQTIPTGVKVRIAGPAQAPVDPKKTRRWWRARLSRLQAELHAAQDGRQKAEKDLAAAVKTGVPVADRAPQRKRVSEAVSAEKKAQAALDAFFAEAKDRKIPERWLR